MLKKRSKAAAPRRGPNSGGGDDPLPGRTTFIDALIPELVRSCGLAMEDNLDWQNPGAGMKKLRLLSKGARLAVQKAVQGYTLKLTSPMGDPQAQPDSPSLAAFLNKCHLARLHVDITPPESETGAAKLTRKLAAFVKNASPALRTVTHLTIALPPIIGCDVNDSTASTAMLLPLAKACPALQHLTLHGRFGSRLLQDFGSICPALSQLTAILTNLSPSTLQALPTLLPHLTTLTAVPRPPLPMNQYSSEEGSELEQERDGKAIQTALAACTGLVSVDIGSCEITRVIWHALPPGLHSLVCSTSPSMCRGEVWQPHASLRTLELAGSVNVYSSQDSGRVAVSALACLLTAAPNISSCLLSCSSVVEATFSRADAIAAQVVNARIGAGLALTGMRRAYWQHLGEGHVTLLFEELSDERVVTNKASRSYQHDMSTFMSTHMTRPLRHFPEVEFHNEDGETEAAADLTHLARVFPRLETLTVNNMFLRPSDAAALVACKALREIIFSTVDGFEISGLRLVCSKNKALRKFELNGCRGITADEGEVIVGKHGSEGRVGRVLVQIERGEVLDDEEWKMNQYGSSSDGGDGSSNEGDEDENEDEDQDEDDMEYD